MSVCPFIHMEWPGSQWTDFHEMFQTRVVEKIKTHVLCSVNFFLKLGHLWDNVEKYGRTRYATDDNIIQLKKDVICMPKTKLEYGHTLIIFNTYYYYWQQYEILCSLTTLQTEPIVAFPL